MGLSYLPVTNYQDLVKKLAHQFAASKHRKMSTTNLFNILQGPSKSLRASLVYFDEVTIKVVHSNYEMFIEVF